MDARVVQYNWPLHAKKNYSNSLAQRISEGCHCLLYEMGVAGPMPESEWLTFISTKIYMESK